MGEFLKSFLGFLGREKVQDVMLGKAKLMGMREIYEQGRGCINEKSFVMRRCITMLKAALLVCICVLAVSVILFLWLKSLWIAAAFYLSVSILILTDLMFYRFTYGGRFNKRHPVAVVGRTVTGILSVEFMLWIPIMFLVIAQGYFMDEVVQGRISKILLSVGWTDWLLAVGSSTTALTFLVLALLCRAVCECRVEPDFCLNLDSFLDIFVVHFKDDRVFQVDLGKYIVNILDTQNVHYQDISITNIEDARSNAQIIKKEDVDYIQNCSNRIVFSDDIGRWVKECQG